MTIVSQPANKNYRDNYDEVFGKKEETKPAEEKPQQEQQFTPECSESCVIVGACTHVSK